MVIIFREKSHLRNHISARGVGGYFKVGGTSRSSSLRSFKHSGHLTGPGTFDHFYDLKTLFGGASPCSQFQSNLNTIRYSACPDILL